VIVVSGQLTAGIEAVTAAVADNVTVPPRSPQLSVTVASEYVFLGIVRLLNGAFDESENETPDPTSATVQAPPTELVQVTAAGGICSVVPSIATEPSKPETAKPLKMAT
jgi:hypothetical protein